MNKQRRKRIAEIISKLDPLIAEIEEIRDDEQEYFDNMPENMQNGEKGQAAEAAVDSLTEAADNVRSGMDCLEGVE